MSRIFSYNFQKNSPRDITQYCKLNNLNVQYQKLIPGKQERGFLLTGTAILVRLPNIDFLLKTNFAPYLRMTASVRWDTYHETYYPNKKESITKYHNFGSRNDKLFKEHEKIFNQLKRKFQMKKEELPKDIKDMNWIEDVEELGYKRAEDNYLKKMRNEKNSNGNTRHFLKYLVLITMIDINYMSLFNRIKYIFRELWILVSYIILCTMIIFPYLEEYFELSGLSLYIQIILVIIGTFFVVSVETYGLFFIIPYIVFNLFRYLLYKKKILVKVRYIMVLSIILVVPMYIVFIPRFLSCQLDYNYTVDGYYKTEYQVCYSTVTGFVGGSSYTARSIKQANYESFIVLDENKQYAKDKNRVYYSYLKPMCSDCFTVDFDPFGTIQGSDPNTFEFLQDSYSRDKKHVYKDGETVEDLDPNNFVIQ